MRSLLRKLFYMCWLFGHEKQDNPCILGCWHCRHCSAYMGDA